MNEVLGSVFPMVGAPALLFALALTLIVGLLLGMVGGGGSIVVVPILVYVIGLSASAAIALSLPIVGLTSLAGAVIKARRDEVHWRSLWVFGLSGAVGALLGAQLTRLVPQPLLLLMFASLLLAVSVKMWRDDIDETSSNSECHTGRCAIAGGIVGILTGFLGVGGGFLLVPALNRFANQSMKIAIGTSLAIISLNSAAGFAGHIGEISGLLPLAALLIALSLLGLWGGLHLAERVPGHILKKLFAGVALIVAAYLVFANLPAAIHLFVN